MNTPVWRKEQTLHGMYSVSLFILWLILYEYWFRWSTSKSSSPDVFAMCRFYSLTAYHNTVKLTCMCTARTPPLVKCCLARWSSASFSVSSWSNKLTIMSNALATLKQWALNAAPLGLIMPTPRNNGASSSLCSEITLQTIDRSPALVCVQ
jgi:hypothetical protein